jgi:hypothetical protein
MLVIGFWVAREIERGRCESAGCRHHLYVAASFHTRTCGTCSTPIRSTAAHRTALDALLTDTPLGQKIIAFNIFKPDGRIVYSTNASVIGQTIPIGEGLATALGGEIHSTIIVWRHTAPWHLRNVHGRRSSSKPTRRFTCDGERLSRAWPSSIQPTDELARETAPRSVEDGSWLPRQFVMYLVLFGLVRRGSKTIARQRGELNERVSELSTLLARNARLDARSARRGGAHELRRTSSSCGESRPICTIVRGKT